MSLFLFRLAFHLPLPVPHLNPYFTDVNHIIPQTQPTTAPRPPKATRLPCGGRRRKLPSDETRRGILLFFLCRAPVLWWPADVVSSPSQGSVLFFSLIRHI